MRAVALPAGIAVALLALLMGAVLHLSTSRSDAIALARQDRLMALAVQQSLAAVTNDQEASTLWDDAVLRLRERPLDFDWIDNNLGVWFHSFYDHDETYLLDPANRPIYAMQAGVRSPPQTFGRVSSQIIPLVKSLRARLPSGYLTSEKAEEQTIGRSDIVIIENRPAFVSVKPIVSETGEIEQIPGAEYLHISVRYLDGTFLSQLSEQYGVDRARFEWQPLGEAVLPVRNQEGAIIGYFAWSPFQPGAQVKNAMAPTLAIALLLIGGLLACLLSRIWQNRMELEASRAQAQHLAFHDALTGLPNRALFEDRLAGALGRSRRNGRTAILLLDLDRFKNVNDTLGHQAGDALIREFGIRLSAILRDGDTVARLGGDEFAILVESMAHEEVIALCERVLGVVHDSFDVLGNQAFVGVSIGVATAVSSSEESAELIRKADIALYRAKEEGRNRYRVFDNSMDASVRLRGNLEEDLRHALSTGQGLVVHYQPQVDGPDGKIVGLEALVRWQHPTRGLVSPEQFVPLAEETGLIGPLGEWVLREACATSVRWSHLFMALNLSPVQIRSADFFETLLGIVVSTGANPSNIELEITEHVLLDDDDIVRAVLKKLRGAGFRIVLDDFGTGYSSMSYLHKFKVDKIKIDKSFVRYLGLEDDSTPIVVAVLALGQAMGLTVAAEGVETAEQRSFLKGAGCEEMQGYLFSQAVPAEELPKLLGSPVSSAAA